MRGVTKQQAELRKSFKRALARKNREEFFLALTAAEIAELSVPQVLKLIRFTQSERFDLLSADDQELMRHSLKTGILCSDEIRIWYNQKLKKMRDMARVEIPHIWKASGVKIYDQMTQAFDNLGREEELQDFFTILGVVQEAVGDRMEEAGLRNFTGWRRDRFLKGLFPRVRSLRREFKLCGENKIGLIPFRDRVAHAIQKLPEYAREFVNGSGYVFRLAERLGHIDPDYAQKDAHYARGLTIEQTACGVHDSDTLNIDLPQYSVTNRPDGTKESYLAHNDFEELAVTVGHEVAHGFVLWLDYVVHHDERIKQAYREDLADIRDAIEYTPGIARQYSYFMPASEGGYHADISVAREEAMVEIMSELMLRKGGMDRGDLHLYMVRMNNIAMEMLETLRAEHMVMPSGVDFPDLAALDALTQQPFTPQRALKRYAYDCVPRVT